MSRTSMRMRRRRGLRRCIRRLRGVVAGGRGGKMTIVMIVRGSTRLAVMSEVATAEMAAAEISAENDKFVYFELRIIFHN